MLSAPAVVELRGVCFSYGNPHTDGWVLDNISLSVARGEAVCLVGPNGCGKTTCCGLAFGLRRPSSGVVLHNGRELDGPVEDGAIVPQGDSLYPWMTSLQQICFALECRGVPRDKRRNQARQALAEMGVESAAELYPHHLSGGMKQRVAIARAMAISPSFLVIDEPSALDPPTRERLQEDLVKMRIEKGLTLLAVSHDVDEAAFLSSRVVFLGPKPGRIVGDMPSPLAPNRDGSIRQTQEFLSFRTQLWTALRELNNERPFKEEYCDSK